jgi:hypothetical protein
VQENNFSLKRLRTISLLASATTVLSVCVSVSRAAHAEDCEGISCIEEIEIPRYSAVARLALRTGTVQTRVKIGKKGRPVEIILESPDPKLADEVRGWLKHTGRFRAVCQGREIHLLFTFRLEGEPTPNPFAIIRFRPPNHFIIISQPMLPVIDSRPPPEPKADNGGEQP